VLKVPSPKSTSKKVFCSLVRILPFKKLLSKSNLIGTIVFTSKAFSFSDFIMFLKDRLIIN
jgi:hypothetical protein